MHGRLEWVERTTACGARTRETQLILDDPPIQRGSLATCPALEDEGDNAKSSENHGERGVPDLPRQHGRCCERWITMTRGAQMDRQGRAWLVGRQEGITVIHERCLFPGSMRVLAEGPTMKHEARELVSLGMGSKFQGVEKLSEATAQIQPTQTTSPPSMVNPAPPNPPDARSPWNLG
jgi:hypothetical protein